MTSNIILASNLNSFWKIRQSVMTWFSRTQSVYLLKQFVLFVRHGTLSLSSFRKISSINFVYSLLECHTWSARYFRTKILQGFSYRILLVNQFPKDDFHCPVADAVHGSNPFHLVGCFQLLCYDLRCFHLVDNDFKVVLCLLVQISRICPERPLRIRSL